MVNWEKIWKKGEVTHSKVPSQHLSERHKGNQKEYVFIIGMSNIYTLYESS
jgi:hypothetical protein